MDLLERSQSLESLAGALEQAARGCGRTVLVSGEAGIGKTSLVSAFVEMLHRDASTRVLSGGCEALFSPRPLGPLYDIAPQLNRPLPDALDRDRGRAQLFAAVLAELSANLEPTVLIIEDVHWADAATLDLVKYLARRIARMRVLLVLTYRDDEIGDLHPLRLVLGDLPPSGVTRVPLLPLSEAAVLELARRARRPGEGVYAATGGNPFFVTEALRSDGLPASITDAVNARVARQTPDVRAIVELAAIVPARIERSVVDRLLAPSSDALAAALASGLLNADGDYLLFRHELARLAVERALPADKTRALHARVLACLDTGAVSGVAHARLVHHAARAGDRDAVLRHAPEAAFTAASHGAHREAASLYEAAIANAGTLAPQARSRLLERLAYECYLTDRMADAIAAREAALAIFRALRDHEGEGRTLRWLSRLNWFRGHNVEAERYADAAVELLARLPPGRELAWAFSNRAQLHMLSQRFGTAIEWGTRAIALATETGDDEALAHALNNVGTSEFEVEPDRARPHLERSLALSLERNYAEHAARAYANLCSSLVAYRDYRACSRFDEAAAYFQDRDLDAWANYVRAWRARLALEQGDWTRAEEDAGALALPNRSAEISRMPALVVLGRLRARRGDPGARALLDAAAKWAFATGELQRIAPVVAALGELAWLTGEPPAWRDAMLASAKLARERPFAHTHAEIVYWLWKCGIDAGGIHGDSPHALQRVGRWSEAASSWLALGCPYERALALTEGDVPAMRESLRILESLGASATAARCREQLHALGARGIPRGPRPSTAENPARLTTRELEILGLVASGLANADIARRINRSKKTVDHHVSAILAKLDVRSRTEAAAAARRLGLPMR
jgi:DNA-binding CsgD family transcriptional regulator/tetratricopeptide (TPR) repeat protein